MKNATSRKIVSIALMVVSICFAITSYSQPIVDYLSKVRFSKDGQFVFAISYKNIYTWDFKTGKLVSLKSLSESWEVKDFSPNGTFYVGYNMMNRKYRIFYASDNSVMFETDEQGYIANSEQWYVTDKNIYESKTGKKISKTKFDKNSYGYKFFSKEGLQFFYQEPNSWDNAMLYDLIQNKVINQSYRVNAQYKTFFHLFFSEKSPYLVYTLEGFDSLTIADKNTGSYITSFRNGSYFGFDIDPSGKYLVYNENFIGNSRRNLVLYDIYNKKEINRLVEEGEDLTDIRYSGDGNFLTCSYLNDGGIAIYDARELKLIKNLNRNDKATTESLTQLVTSKVQFVMQNGHNGTPPLIVHFSTDSKYLVSYDNQNIKLWEIISSKLLYTISCPKLFDIAISPDNQYLVGVNQNYEWYIWDAMNGQLIKSSKDGTWSGCLANIGFIDNKSFAVEANQAILYSFPDFKEIERSNDYVKKYFNRVDLHSKYQNQLPEETLSQDNYLSVSNDGSLMAVGFANQNIAIYNIKTQAVEKLFPSSLLFVSNEIAFDDVNGIVAYPMDKTIYFIDINSGKILKTIHDTLSISHIRFSNNDKYFYFRTFYKDKWNSEVEKINRYCLERNSLSNVDASYNFTHFDDIIVDKDHYICGIDKHCYGGIDFSVEKFKYANGDYEGSPKKRWTLKGHTDWIIAGRVFRDLKKAVSASRDGTIKIWDLDNKEMIFNINSQHGNILNIIISHNQKLLASANQDNTVSILDVETGKTIVDLPGHSVTLSTIYFTNDDKYIITSGNDYQIRKWDILTGRYTLIMAWKNNWFLASDDGYFDCNLEAGPDIALSENQHGFGIDQIALRYNRPDLILKQMGNNDTSLTDHLYHQYIKRLRKSGITEDQLSEAKNLPSVSVSNSKQEGKFVVISFNLKGVGDKLKSYNIYVNDVPQFGISGKILDSKEDVSLSETVELSSGDNKIEISCINDNGYESYRAIVKANYSESVTRDLYFLAFGVSKYQNSTYNLQFADKDALDLEKVMQNFKGKGFENIYTKVLTNEQVTPDAIRAAKDFVKNAKPDDTFVLFIAGHGIHDTDPEATYYFLTSNADLKNLKGTAADFETIEDLLQGIPPRNKLFLMDACESGEIDDEDQGQMVASASGVGINSRGFKVLQATTSTSSLAGASPKRTYLFQKDRYIYNDLVRRSGAIIFSSCKGGELSYERSDIENGLFTEYIMKALTTSEADKDNNGFISTDELRQYVSELVAKASGDLQHPTVDRDNIYQKFGFQVK